MRGSWSAFAAHSKKINALRSDIVGRQAIGWSQHIYPLVAALNEAGFEGAGYAEARASAKAEDDKRALLEAKARCWDAELPRHWPHNSCWGKCDVCDDARDACSALAALERAQAAQKGGGDDSR